MDFFSIFEEKVKKQNFNLKRRRKKKYVYVRCNCQNIVKHVTPLYIQKRRFEFILLCFFKCFFEKNCRWPPLHVSSVVSCLSWKK